MSRIPGKLMMMVVALAGLWFVSSGILAKTCRTTHHYIGNAPKEKKPGWHKEAQGLSHDSNQWFITQASRIWVIPVSHNLNKPVRCRSTNKMCRRPRNPIERIICKRRPVACLHIKKTPLGRKKYNHYGDPGWHSYRGRGYLFVPIEISKGDKKAAVAVFRTSRGNIRYLSYTRYLFRRGPKHTNAAWISLDSKGYLYTSSGGKLNYIVKLKLDWPHLHKTGKVRFLKRWLIPLYYRKKGRLISIRFPTPQGGTFGPHDIFYMLNGDAKKSCKQCRIHVFQLFRKGSRNKPCTGHEGSCYGVRIEASRKKKGPFRYEYHPGFSKYEEPEGLTYWDLRRTRAPGRTSGKKPIRSSQLHAMMLDNELRTSEVYIKHYRANIRCR